MNAIRVLRAALAATCAAVACFAMAAEPLPVEAPAAKRLPIEAFASLPAISAVTLSPDGTRHAAVITRKGVSYVVATEMATGETTAVAKADNEKTSIGWVRWVNDERLLIEVIYEGVRGHWIRIESRILSVKRDGTGAFVLANPSWVEGNTHSASNQARVIDWLPEDGHHVLMSIAGVAGSRFPSVMRIDVDTGSREVVQPAEENVLAWLTDAQHRVRVARRWTPQGFEVRVCDPDGSHWRTAWNASFFAAEAVLPLGFGRDPDVLFVQALEGDHDAVFSVDLRDPQLKRTTVLAVPGHDMDGSLVVSARTGEAVGVRGGLIGASQASYWDADMRKLAAGIDRVLAGRGNALVEVGRDGQHYVVRSAATDGPQVFFVGDRAKGSLRAIGSAYPDLPAAALSAKKAYRVRARDGREMEVFLTLPRAASPARLPTVLLPHGGPIANDTTLFDPWSQFLANRGYAVLQVNFRGSTGAGHAHMAAGLKNWGLAMQDDLTDALAWMVGRGTADPARVCIVGGSYGGYAALMGAVKTPDAFRCVVSFGGVSDLFQRHEEIRHSREALAVFNQMVGSAWEEDAEQFRATSPVLHADAIKAPVLLVHGTDDFTVGIAHSKAMNRALRGAGKSVKFVEQEGGDHHLSSQAQRLEFFKELEAFLDQHLGSAPVVAAGR